MAKVESFDLDHTKVRAPYVRIAGVKHTPKGDTITKYDLRLTQKLILQPRLEADLAETGLAHLAGDAGDLDIEGMEGKKGRPLAVGGEEAGEEAVPGARAHGLKAVAGVGVHVRRATGRSAAATRRLSARRRL